MAGQGRASEAAELFKVAGGFSFVLCIVRAVVHFGPPVSDSCSSPLFGSISPCFALLLTCPSAFPSMTCLASGRGRRLRAGVIWRLKGLGSCEGRGFGNQIALSK